ncbi:hypothetical protein GYMLUDRAFT_290636 [Collybiopsis luxurians FD-317 M1]|nr:hypothetical protein GYMLUDRAFT_290636 [Collybiopsis luxurians FD-317 M1]
MSPSLATFNHYFSRRVHFGDQLAKPPSDRPRMEGLIYPRVAQIKGESDRQESFDLRWEFDTLSGAGTTSVLEASEDERVFVTPETSTPYPVNLSRLPRMPFSQHTADQTTAKMPKLPSSSLSNVLIKDSHRVLCTPPLLCSSRFSGDGSSVDGDSTYSSSASSSDSDL